MRLQFCWGGKVVELVTSSPKNPFSVAATAHPAMIDPSGAEKISVPFILLASGEEPVDVVESFKAKLKVPHHIETFGDQVHGWMAARADLSNPRVSAEYARGYQTLLAFFDKHWM
jgi:dienelactone hydrolase